MIDSIRKLPVGIQSFEKLIDNNNLYVDKTEYIYQLVHTGIPYFLSRPHRFGKSLLLSTLKAYWEGRRDLFAGLRIEELESDNPDAWQPYPVFYFDFNGKNYQNTQALETALDGELKDWEEQYGVKAEDGLEERFKRLLKRAYEQTGKRCVILVDDYDKPLLETMEKKDLREHNKAVFKGFFSTLKSEDEYIQFIFITGVTRFSELSIFSDLNQLSDISFEDEYSGICGITEQELLGNFAPEIESMARVRSLTKEDCIRKLRTTYAGYHFSADGEEVYNPHSLLTALKKQHFLSCWFQTETPTFLVRRLRATDFDVRQFSDIGLQSTEEILSDFRVDNPDPIPMLYQTGYLTLIECDGNGVYTLGIPNEEVRYAFLQSLICRSANHFREF